jgi:hypothetical protein
MCANVGATLAVALFVEIMYYLRALPATPYLHILPRCGEHNVGATARVAPAVMCAL